MYACSSDSGTHPSTCPNPAGSIVDAATNMRANAHDVYESQVQVSQAFIANTQQAFQPFKSFYLEFITFVGNVEGLLSGAANANEGSSRGIGAFGYEQMDPSLGPSPSLAPASEFSSILDSTGTITTLSALNEQIIGEMSSTTSNVQASTQANAAAIVASQSAFSSSLFPDYDPPTYDVSSANTRV